MRSETSIQGDRLANALRFLGVNFIIADENMPETIHKHSSSQYAEIGSDFGEAAATVNMLKQLTEII